MIGSILSILSKVWISWNVLHLSDIHFDPFYKEGSSTRCLGDNLGLTCCRPYDIRLRHTDKPAGPMGDYACDTSELLINSTFSWISKNKDIDLILYTGDTFSHHDIADLFSPGFKYTPQKIQNFFDKYFSGIPVINTIGNHDVHIVDQTIPYFYPKSLHTLEKIWNISLNGGGYYKTNFKNQNIIVLNNLFWQDTNLFSRLMTEEKKKQFNWLRQELDKIRNKNEKVWLLFHIPPSLNGEDETSKWTLEYMKILRDYTDIIILQLSGHTHHDTFKIISIKDKIIGSVLVAPSLQPDKHDPLFRIYETEGGLVKDYVQYIADLEYGNKHKILNYTKHYRFSDEYGKYITSENMFKLYKRLGQNNTLFELFKNRFKPYVKKNNSVSNSIYYNIPVIVDNL